VEWPDAKKELEAQGIEADRIDLVLPPVNLRRFQVVPPPAGPFTVLFASSPEEADWLAARGVDLLLDAAALRPQMRFKLVWRPWGNSLPQLQRWIAERELTNVEVAVGRFPNMEMQYQSAHVTIAPFTSIDRCKPAPNSLVESLAAGRPVVATECVGLSSVVESAGAGVRCQTSSESIAESLDRIEAQWQQYSACARQLAEDRFSESTFLASYERIYARLLNR
jgi:glycosyltransferase involved in cell wall biosynthesis